MYILLNTVLKLNYKLKIYQKMRTFKKLEEIRKTWKKFGKSEWQPCNVCSFIIFCYEFK